MINKKLTSLDYYLKKLSLFLKNSYGISDQIETNVYVLQLIDETVDTCLEMLNVLDDEVFAKIQAISTTESDILDKIAHLYAIDRKMTVNYYDTETSTDVSELLTLNNFELWLLIKAKILQNYFDGSFIQAREYYDKMNLPVYLLNNVTTGEVLVYLDKTVGISGQPLTDNIKHLFKANMFTIKSMGIKYATQIVDLASLGIWDSNEATQTWDNGVWSI